MHPTRLLKYWPQALRQPETGSGGGGGDSGAGGGGQPQQQQQQQQQQQNAPSFDASDLPEGLRGQTIEDTYGKVKGEYFNLRGRVAEFAPPKDATGYAFEPAEPIKPYFANKDKDEPWMALSRETALKHGMPAKMFAGFMNDLFSQAKDKGLMPALYSPESEAARIGEGLFKDLTGPERDDAVKKAVTEASAFAPTLADQLKLSPAGKAELIGMADFAGGIEVLRAVKGLMAEKGIAVGGEPNNQAFTREDYDRAVADERYSPFSSKFDKAWREGIDQKARALFGK